MSHVAIWKYYDEEMRYYFNDSATVDYHPTYVDRIQINKVAEFPTFDLKVENNGGLLDYTAGDFRVRLSLLQTETSVSGDTIREFLFPEIKPCKFLCQVYISDDCHWAGFFTSTDLTQALSYNKNDKYIDIKVTGALREFADSYSQLNQGTRVPGSHGFWTFEAYLIYHFDERSTWSLELPSTSYKDRIGSTNVGFNTELQRLVNLYGTGFNNVPRWETFQGLRRGLGFDIKLQFESPSVFITQRPDFKLKIFWLPDIIEDDAINVNILTHDVEYVLNSKPNLFIPSRYSTVTFTTGDQKLLQGVVFSDTDTISISANDSEYPSGGSMPAFIRLTNGDFLFVQGATKGKELLYYQDGLGGSKTFDFDSAIQQVDMEYYSYSQQIYDSIFRKGAMTYAFFFGEGANHRHNKVQEYLVNIYKRFLSGIKEVKILDVEFLGNEGIDLYKRISSNDKDYYISEINSIDLFNKTASIKAIEL